MAERQDRYPGLRSFEEKDADLFFGRDDEIIELTRTIISERVTVIFGASGSGKSSLLNTVFRKSEPLSMYRPVKIRFTSLNLKGKRNRNLTPLQTADKYLTKEIPGVARSRIVYNERKPKLWEYVKRAELAVTRNKGQKLIFIFDQFEEYFTYSPDEQQEFNELLAEIVHELTPTRILQWVTSLQTEDRTEEVLEWYRQPDIKLIFSIRSDKLSSMNSMVKQVPQILRNRMELKLFKVPNARQAIVCPAELPNTVENLKFNSPPIIIDKKVVERIVDDLSNSFSEIEAAFLQIVCFTIENQVKGMAKNLVEKFDYGENLFNEQIDIATILDRYYNASLDKLSEADTKLVKRVIEDKLVVEGSRTSLLAPQLQKELGPDHPRLIPFLLTARLIREENTSRGLTYELSHDKLIGPVERSKAIREEQEKAEQQALEAKKKYDLQSKLIKQEKAKIEEYKLRVEAYRSKEKLRRLTFYFAILSAAFVGLSIYFFITSRTMKRTATRYKAEFYLTKAKDAFRNYDYFSGFNFLWAADSLNRTKETDTLLDNASAQLLLGMEILQSDDGNYLLSQTKDSTIYIWKADQDHLQLLNSFENVRGYFVSGAFNKAAIFRRDSILIWDIKKNSPIDSLVDEISNAQGDMSDEFQFSYYGNTMIFVDTFKKVNLVSIENNGLQKIQRPAILDSVSATHSMKISRDGKRLLLDENETLYYFELSTHKTGEIRRIRDGELGVSEPFSDSAIYFIGDSLYIFDLNTGKQEQLLSFKTYFPRTNLRPNYKISSTHIFIQQREKPYQGILIALDTKRPDFKCFDRVRSNIPFYNTIVFNQDGLAYVDTSGRIKFTKKYTGKPEVLDSIVVERMPLIVRRTFKLRFAKTTPEFYFTLHDTLHIRNYVDFGTSDVLILKNLKDVQAIDRSSILASFIKENSTYSQLLPRSPLTRKEARKRVPYFDAATKDRYGL